MNKVNFKIKQVVNCFIICMFLFTMSSQVSSAQAETSPYLSQAEALKTLGLFQGTANGFELNRKPTRIEGAAMLVRLLGKEKIAEEQKNAHPFSDVPAWADNIVGYMYKNGLTSGVTETTFGSTDELGTKQYATFLLRALGYDDSKGDFNWQNAIDKLVQIGMIDTAKKPELEQITFTREYIALLSYNSLMTNLNTTTQRLIDKLINEGAISKDAAIETGFVQQSKSLIKLNEGISFFRSGSNIVDTHIYKSKMPVDIQSYSHVAVVSFDTSNAYQDALSKMEEKTFDYSKLYFTSAQSNDNAYDNRLYPFTINNKAMMFGSEEQKKFYAIAIIYNANKQAVAFYNNQVPDFQFPIMPINFTNTTKVDSAKMIQSGIEDSISKDETSVTYKVTFSLKDLPSFLKDRSNYYVAFYSKTVPTNIAKDGVPIDVFSYIHRIGGTNGATGFWSNSLDESYQYIALVFFDENKNILGYYEKGPNF